MDHIFEQKLINEQVALRNTLAQHSKKAKELMEQIQAYDLMLENFAVSYLENGGSPEELQELFDMAGMKEKGRAILSKVREVGGKAAKAVGHGILAASLIASPATATTKRTIPGTPGTPEQAAVIEKGTTKKVAAPRPNFGKGSAIGGGYGPGAASLDSGRQVEYTGGTVHPSGHHGHDVESWSPSGWQGPSIPSHEGGDTQIRQMMQYIKNTNIFAKGPIEQHPAYREMEQELERRAAVRAGKPAPGETTVTTPDRVVKAAVPAVPGTPSKTEIKTSLTAVPQREGEMPKGLPKVVTVKRRRREGPIDVTPVPGSESTESTPSHVGAFSVPRGRPIVPQRTPSPSPMPSPRPEPSPSPAPEGTKRIPTSGPTIRRTNAPQGTVPVSTADPRTTMRTVGSTNQPPLVPTPKARIPISKNPRLARFEESVEQIIRNILNEG